MTNLIKQVMILIGTLVASLLLFSLVFGSTGKELIWNEVEPVLQNSWQKSTFNDGVQISTQITETFNSAVEISD